MLTTEEIREFLPNLDCRQCGLTCTEFADLLITRELAPEDCPVLHEPDYAGFIEALHELLGETGVQAAAGMQIDPDKCIGCGICVTMCEFHLGNCADARLGKGPRNQDTIIFHIVNGAVVVVHQERCTRLVQAAEKCSKCAEYCPTKAITLY
jgi:Na+-translocating ferredoxin:NAD+ oxidoreductase RNF subunit RnfB